VIVPEVCNTDNSGDETGATDNIRPQGSLNCWLFVDVGMFFGPFLL